MRHPDKTSSARRYKNLPFVCQKIPFVCKFYPSNRTFIGCFIPSIGFGGFTLIELIITLTIVGILTTIAAPSMTSFVQNNRLRTQVTDFVVDLNYARSEATKQKLNIGICPGTVGGGCDSTLSWQSGRLVFLDADNSSSWSAGDTSLRSRGALEGNNTLANKTTGGKIIIFGSAGNVANPGTGDGTYAFCDRRGASNGRGAELLNTGRVRSFQDVTVSGC
jgi:type IV fimbrial biogenesis protein FimT